MEPSTAQEASLIVAEESSSSSDHREPSTFALDSPPFVREIPSNPRIDETNLDRATDRESPVKFHEPDFTYLEITSRLDRESTDIATSPEPISIPGGCSMESTNNEKDAAEGALTCRKFDSSMCNSRLIGSGVLAEIDSAMYDECLFSDEALAAASSRESTPSRKRQAGDFMPLNAEIKRIGVEISDEQAKQLMNDVRRLSPILVSLRERTLGEISLTSDSGLFDENDRNLRHESAENNGPNDCPESSKQTEEPATTISSKATTSDDAKFRESTTIVANDASNSLESFHGSSLGRSIDDIVESSKDNDRSTDRCSGEDVQLDSLAVNNGPGATNVQRELMIVLSRVDSPEIGAGIKVSAERENSDEASVKSESYPDGIAENKKIDDGLLVPVINGPRTDEASVTIAGNVTEKCKTNDCPDETADKNGESQKIEDSRGTMNEATSPGSVVLVGDVCLSPKYHDNDQLRRKSPKVMIERTLEDATAPRAVAESTNEQNEESSPRANLDRVRRTLENSLVSNENDEARKVPDDVPPSDDPLTINADALRVTSFEQATDGPESLDTETETCSDNSENISIASINSQDCVEAQNDGSICRENDSVVSDEAARDTLTRLEPEQPEAFTEDSAESLTLATGARDEVRSDGSDSGLGSEIPGDPGPAPAPESDSETSFLDRIPDDILSDKDKAVNPLEAFVPDPGALGIQQEQLEIHHQQQQIPLPCFPTPTKSSLKRRLTDCMEGEPSPKRINTDDPMRKKRNIQFDAVTVYYFPRAQGFTCVPSQGGSTLGMSATHTHAERFSLTEHAAEQRRLHRARLAQLRSERAANCVTEAASSSEDPSDDTDEEPSDTEELDIDSYYFLQPVPTWQRRALLRAAGVRRIDAVEKDDCRDIRASREHCGCGCKGYCDPESCPCSRANVKCQVDRAGFPCGCSRDGCANSSGRIEFNPVRVRTHFIHTLMRLQLEKKQRDEDRTDHDPLLNNQLGRAPMREVVPGLMATALGPSMEHPSVITGDPVSCINAGGFTTLHYENHDPAAIAACQPGTAHATREESLDLYAIRDDCYTADATDPGSSSQRKLHPEFGQAFQAFPGQQPAVSFPQSAYQDYQGYQALATTSRSQFPSQFQNVPTANPSFGHYAYGQDTGIMQSSCQSHAAVSTHHASIYDTGFSQDDPIGNQQQYTNLNSVQPMNAVVQQMGKLEPFSELLAGRYSYYGDPELQTVASDYHGNLGTKIEPDKSQIVEQRAIDATDGDDCDENFGEIIKKSMVETVSA